MSQVRARLGDILIQAGAITAEELRVALERQAARPDRVRLGRVIVEERLASEHQIARALAQQLSLPYVDLAQVVNDPELLNVIPMKLAQRHELVPLRRNPDGSITVAMADPTNVVAIDDIRSTPGVGKVNLAVATMSAVSEALSRMYGMDVVANDIVSRLGVAADIDVTSTSVPESAEGITELERSAQSAPVVRLVNGIIADAINMRASDIHVEPQPTEVRIRYRVDGLLRDVMSVPKHIQALLVSRIKIMAGMDIADRRRPQDGRTTIVVGAAEIDTRISTIPTMSGEKVVMRLLSKVESSQELDGLGFEPKQLELLKGDLQAPQGLVIFTGPTGSGKTTTMYASLRELSGVERNIITLEDPIEYQLPGMNQVAVAEKTGLSFASGLRSILRQDPDVIMVGEVRDLETAQMVVQSALTGHLVLTSLHTNDAISAVTRLVDLGVEPFRIAPVLRLVIAQRLVRVICQFCREPAEVSDRTLQLLHISRGELDTIKVTRGAGCEACHFTGYKGRTGIYEFLPATRELREQLTAQVSEVGSLLRPPQSLRAHGLHKVRSGVTTLDEVLRVTHVDVEEHPYCPSCRHEVDPAFVVCPYCQADLGGAVCPRCGRDSDPAWEICPYCRAPLSPTRDLSHERPRILVVDDDPSLRLLVDAIFRDDYDVIQAKTGEEGIRKASLENPDVMLLDLHLPDFSGLEVASRLRNSAATSLIPLIVLTGDDSSEMASLRAGVDDFVTKPFDEALLRLRVETILKRVMRYAPSAV